LFTVIATTLYEELSVPVRQDGTHHGRTERTAMIETIDRDVAVVDLYASLGSPSGDKRDKAGRTEETKATGETVDRDRAGVLMSSGLLAAPVDLYGALGKPPTIACEHGETALTASTETVDYDQPPEGSYA
jgi:hypothetical protein